MSTGPNDSITEQVAKEGSTESNASTHPLHQKEEPKGDKVEFRHHQANPGPAVPGDFNAAQEGTKEERQAKAKELNKNSKL